MRLFAGRSSHRTKVHTLYYPLIAFSIVKSPYRKNNVGTNDEASRPKDIQFTLSSEELNNAVSDMRNLIRSIRRDFIPSDVPTIPSPTVPCTENQVQLSAWEGQGDVMDFSTAVDCEEAKTKAILQVRPGEVDEIMPPARLAVFW